MSEKSIPLTVRVAEDLMELLQITATLSGHTTRDIVGRGLRYELDRMRNAGGEDWDSALDAVQKFRDTVSTPEEPKP